METASGRSAASVIRRLEKQPREFSFFQSLRLLRLAYQEEREDREALFDIFRRHVRVRPLLSLAFPPVDIDGIERLPALQDGFSPPLKADAGTLPLWKLTVTFLGLYGASTPLPIYYTEDLLGDQSQGTSVNRELVDVINQPFYELLWLGWRRYRVPLRIVEEGDSAFFRRLWALGGRDPELLKKKRAHADGFTLRRLALYAQHPRSEQALTALLRDIFQLEAIRIRPFAMRRIPLPPDQRCRMGFANATLGEDCVIGEQMEDCKSCFDLDIGPIDTDTYRDFLPGRELHRKLRANVEDFLDQPLDFMLNLVLAEDDNRSARLQAGHWGSLGEDMWLKAPSRAGSEGGVSMGKHAAPSGALCSDREDQPVRVSFFIPRNQPPAANRTARAASNH